MPARLSPEQMEILKKINLAAVATVMPDGSPQVTLMWVETDGETIYVNSSKGRVKVNNLERDPRVALTIFDTENPYAHPFHVRGRAELVEDESAVEHVHALTKKYVNQDRYPWLQPGEVRVKIRIVPESITNAL
jgi:PPOX class probable F420-dependent enzyme